MSDKNIKEALNDVLRLREDFNDFKDGITSADLWNAYSSLVDAVKASLEPTSDNSEPWTIPEIKYCPHCGSQNLEPKFEGWEEHAQKEGGGFGECSECGTHFIVSGYCEFFIPESEDDDGS